jgi:heat shock protein HtpX
MMFFGGRRERENQNPLALVASLVVLMLAPIAAMLLKSAISRKREALADATCKAST